MTLVIEFINALGPSWGWLGFFLWTLWQTHCPIPGHTTKFQQFHNDLTARHERTEIGQIALAEEIETVDAERYRKLHGQEREVSASELKRRL